MFAATRSISGDSLLATLPSTCSTDAYNAPRMHCERQQTTEHAWNKAYELSDWLSILHAMLRACKVVTSVCEPHLLHGLLYLAHSDG